MPLAFVILSSLSCSSAADIKKEQYIIAGQNLYNTHCANCHGADGKGLAGLYPALQGSSYMSQTDKLYCIISNGKNRPGQQAMPANAKLYAIDKAQLITYLQATFLLKPSAIVEVEDIKKIGCK